MLIDQIEEKVSFKNIISTELTPYVKKIDQEAFYAKNYLKKLGAAGYLSSENKAEKEVIQERIILIEETAKVCMTTAFCLWCHFAATVYVENSKNETLREQVLPKLKTGDLLAGTGLSNPLKSFSQMEQLHLEAKSVAGGFLIHGALPAVSNIGEDHGFAFIAEHETLGPIMGFTFCHEKGITLKQRTGYVGLNGSATYSCGFQQVFIPEDQIISFKAEQFVQKIRPLFVSYQIPLGLGVSAACIESIKKLSERNKSVHNLLKVQAVDLEVQYEGLRKRLCKQINMKCSDWKEILALRTDVVHLTLEAVQANMIHSGGAGYLQGSSATRKLHEAYFLVNLTPTMKHLEWMKYASS